jgi:hypothetical protein
MAQISCVKDGPIDVQNGRVNGKHRRHLGKGKFVHAQQGKRMPRPSVGTGALPAGKMAVVRDTGWLYSRR